MSLPLAEIISDGGCVQTVRLPNKNRGVSSKWLCQPYILYRTSCHVDLGHNLVHLKSPGLLIDGMGRLASLLGLCTIKEYSLHNLDEPPVSNNIRCWWRRLCDGGLDISSVLKSILWTQLLSRRIHLGHAAPTLISAFLFRLGKTIVLSLSTLGLGYCSSLWCPTTGSSEKSSSSTNSLGWGACSLSVGSSLSLHLKALIFEGFPFSTIVSEK